MSNLPIFLHVFAVQMKNIARMSAGSTNLTLQVSDICGQTQTGSLTVVVTNTVCLSLVSYFLFKIMYFYQTVFHVRIPMQYILVYCNAAFEWIEKLSFCITWFERHKTRHNSPT